MLDELKKGDNVYYLNIPCEFLAYYHERMAIVLIDHFDGYDFDEAKISLHPLKVNPEYLSKNPVEQKRLDKKIKTLIDKISKLNDQFTLLENKYNNVRKKIGNEIIFNRVKEFLSKDYPEILINALLGKPIYCFYIGNDNNHSYINTLSSNEKDRIRFNLKDWKHYGAISTCDGGRNFYFISKKKAEQYKEKYIRKEISNPHYEYQQKNAIKLAVECNIDVTNEQEIGRKLLQQKKQDVLKTELAKAELQAEKYRKSLETTQKEK